jgi:tRNA A37 threonylcarbamoyladenosine dehydratase
MPRFSSLDRLYGRGTVATLARCHVCIVGVGGVGSWAAEAFARSGIGKLTLIDADEVCLGNVNRQSHALDGTIGRSKVAVLAERLQRVNPALVVEAIAAFVTPTTIAQHLDRGYDYVFDACDAFRVKVEAIVHCHRRKIPLLTCGSAGGRIDPQRVLVRDLNKVAHDMLLGLVRRALRDEFGWQRNPKRYYGVLAVYSLENVRYPQPDGTVCGARPASAEDNIRLDCATGLGAAMHVTATFAMHAVGKIIERLLLKAARRD